MTKFKIFASVFTKYFISCTDWLGRISFWYYGFYQIISLSITMTTYNIIGYSMMAFGTLGMIWRLFFVDQVHKPLIEFTTVQDSLAMYANSVTYKSNNDYNKEQFKRIFQDNKGNMIPQELFTLLQLARDGKLNFYGRKSFSSPRVPLQPIPAEYLFENKSNWSEDYSTIYYNSGDTAYTDVSVKRKELQEILK